MRKCYIGGQIFLVGLHQTIIWNNYNIRVTGKPIFYNSYNSPNIVL